MYCRTQMNQRPLSATSMRDAAALLDAWERGDLAGLNRHLNSKRFTDFRVEGMTAAESERYELLHGIAESMRNTLDRGVLQTEGCDLEVSLELLRHMVRSVQRGDGTDSRTQSMVCAFVENADSILAPHLHHRSREVLLTV
jgi:hypothetical protein